MLDARKLAAVDISFLGARLIVTEFAVGVFGPLALGALTLHKSHSGGGVVLGLYLLFIGVNYVPLLFHAIDLARHGTAREEIADEVADKRSMFRKYRRQSLLLLVPLIVPLSACFRRHASRSPSA
jgi:hypothetical protein